MVDNAIDNLVVLDEVINEDDEVDGDEDSASSSGSSVDVLTVSQLSDPASRMRTINPVEGFVLLSSDDEEDP